ncbi:hypothetical protein [Streptomyces sp. SS07]|uniref:hypothetical protein n=1 Tax=Streptomyces sp. SS07 TaxID=2015315 RepID=UPI000B5CB1EE|nr:hypothetical protein [Streptomyces sp. SS07]
MTVSRLVGSVGLRLGDDEITTRINEYKQASIRIGDALTIDVTDASPDQLRKLAQIADDLANWREERDLAIEVADQVGAEGGYRIRGVRFERRAAAA